MTIKPHSFQAAVETSLPSGGPAGSSVPGRSEEPALDPFIRQDKINAHFKRQAAEENLSVVVGRPRKPAIYGYDSYDIEDALRGIENALPFALAAFRCHLENNEHVASFVDFQGFADRLTDLVADDLRGPLMKRMDEMRGDR